MDDVDVTQSLLGSLMYTSLCACVLNPHHPPLQRHFDALEHECRLHPAEDVQWRSGKYQYRIFSRNVITCTFPRARQYTLWLSFIHDLENIRQSEPVVMEISSCFGNNVQGYYSLSSTTAKWEGKPKNTLATNPQFQNSPSRTTGLGRKRCDGTCKKAGFGSSVNERDNLIVWYVWRPTETHT